MGYHFFQRGADEVVRLDFTQLEASPYPFMLNIPRTQILRDQLVSPEGVVE
ncbi:hypothetical protein [Nocardia gipuzkoensis]